MLRIMSKCDITISACGSTLYELAALGMPTLGIIVAENQRKIGEKMDSVGMIECLGWHDALVKDVFEERLLNLINNVEYRMEMSMNQRCINKNGVVELSFEINKLVHSKSV